jgi:NDP-sugar pyrophosphorylase family protein
VTHGRQSFTWSGGVIAAGRGERLRPSGGPLKPLVPVSGRTLVERVLWSLAEAGPSEVVIIVNEESVAVRDFVSAERWPFAIRWIVETTPSSMHSFLRVVEALSADDHPGPFLISTVDTVARAGAFASFASAAALSEADVSLAVHTPSDDEKPLLVRVGARGRRIEAIGQEVSASGPGREHVFATAGYYAVRPSILAEAETARAEGLSALRLFFGRLVVRGYHIDAIPVADGVDVDRPADVSAAESFLRQAGVS